MTNTKSYVPRDKLTLEYMKYLIHDNCSRPFLVKINKEEILVYTFSNDDYDLDELDDINDDDLSNLYNIQLLRFTDFQGYWSGFDISEDAIHGNSLLIKETANKYVSIGCDIYRFTTDTEIEDYISPIGPNDVPYPVAYSKDYVFFMLEKQYVEKSQLITIANVENAEDIYSEFYGHLYPENKKNMQKHNINRFELSHKRLY